jgi:hypothetical protein
MKKQIFLASYKGTHSGIHGIINVGIRHATSSQYSHTEICIGNPFDRAVACLSASGVDGGVRIKRMRLDPEKWDLVACHGIKATNVMVRFSLIEGCGYDYFGAARFAVPLIFPARQHASKWFCSEAALFLLGLAKGEEWRFEPASANALALQIFGPSANAVV